MFGHISTQELQYIDCPRCKYIIKHAEKRIQAKEYVSKNVAIGVCDHCRNKNNLQIPCYESEHITNKFITSSKEKSDDLEQKRRTWLSKVKHLHKDVKIDAEISDTQIESPAHFQSHLSKLHGIIYKDHTFRKVEDPKIKIRSKPIRKFEENEISTSNIKQVYRTRSFDSYLQKLENASNLTDTLKLGKRYRSKPDRIMSPVWRDDAYSADKTYTHKPDQEKRLDIQDFDSYHQSFKKYISKPEKPMPRGYDPFYQSGKKYVTKDDFRKLFDTEYYDIHYREGKKYDPEPRSRAVTDVNEYTSHYQPQEKEFVTPFDEDKLLQQIYLKRDPLDVKKPINVGEEKDKNKQAPKSVKLTLDDTLLVTESIYRTRSETFMLDLENVSVPKSIIKSATGLFSERKPKIDFRKSDDYIEHYVSSTLPTHKTVKEKKYADINSVYSSPNKKYTSEEALSSKSEILLKKDFSYQFPKEIISKKELKRLQTSAELIQETQNMLNVREEEKKQKTEIERTRKLLEQELKNQAREEKKRLQEEKRKEEEEQKRIAEEERKKIAEENRRLEEERKKEEERLKAKAEKKIKEDDNGKLKEKTKTELSEEEKRKAKEEKEKAKEERKKALEEKRKEKEESREKAKSEKVDREKEKADKEADKLKKQKEKEIQLRMQKEEKQREKEEKERRKKEKDEQLRTEKARLQGEKEEEQKNKQSTPKKGKSDDDKKSMPESKQPNIETPKEQQKEKNGATAEDFKKIRNDFNNKDEVLKREKEAQLEKSARDEADKKEKEIEKQGKIHGKEAKAVVKPELVKDITKTDEKKDKPTIKELDIKQIKVRKPSYDDLILRLVKLKQSEPRERIKQKILPVLDVPVVAREHKKHKYTKTSKCIMCIDSEFELDVESILMKPDLPDETMKDIIIGQKIFKYKPPLIDKEDKSIMTPSLFQTTFQAESPIVIKKEPEVFVKDETEHKPAISVPTKTQKLAEQDAPKGIIRYALSDRAFIEKGWTMLPTEKVVRKVSILHFLLYVFSNFIKLGYLYIFKYCVYLDECLSHATSAP
ncbi:hypothetical protein O3G_MSEX007608 [Manduca sexta]|uniref:Uncharacterized protein n=1 Tax=Manduca sexta TaxID=7130 RepID=A0A921Z8Y0_MANSE|nr:hypothetical protein O3G_MSEX007608 [Manduca sexta]